MITKVAPPGRPSSRKLKDAKFEALVDSIEHPVGTESLVTNESSISDVFTNDDASEISKFSSDSLILVDDESTIASTASTQNFASRNVIEPIPRIQEYNVNTAEKACSFSFSVAQEPINSYSSNTGGAVTEVHDTEISKFPTDNINFMPACDANQKLESHALIEPTDVEQVGISQVQNNDTAAAKDAFTVDKSVTENTNNYNGSDKGSITAKDDILLNVESPTCTQISPALLEERARISSQRQRREAFLSKITDVTTNAEANLLSRESQHKQALDRGSSLVSQQIQISSSAYDPVQSPASPTATSMTSSLPPTSSSPLVGMSSAPSTNTKEGNSDPSQYILVPAESSDTSYLEASTSATAAFTASNNEKRVHFMDSDYLRTPSRIAALEDTNKVNRKKNKDMTIQPRTNYILEDVNKRREEVAKTIASGLRESYQGSESHREAWMARQQDMHNQRKGTNNTSMRTI